MSPSSLVENTAKEFALAPLSWPFVVLLLLGNPSALQNFLVLVV